MIGILIRIKPGFHFDGEGAKLGRDSEGNSHIFWKSSGQMEVPVDVALKLEQERPQRFEIVDRNLVKGFKQEEIVDDPIEDVLDPKPVEIVKTTTLKELKSMTKDQINDWAAKRDYDVNTRDKKAKMVKDLSNQILKKTGEKVV